MPGYRLLVISDINEMGNYSTYYHKEVARIIDTIKINKIFSIGKKSIFISKINKSGEHFFSKENLTKKIFSLIERKLEISILIKGSRSFYLEEIIKSIKEKFLC